MGAVMLTAAIAAPTSRIEPIDYEAGRELIKTIQDPSLFGITNDHEIEEAVMSILDQIEDEDEHDKRFQECFDTDDKPTLTALRLVATSIIDALAPALEDGTQTDRLRVAGYDLYISAGPSWGDAPTQAADAIWNAYKLPEDVLVAMGFVPDYSQPLAPTDDPRSED